MQRSHTRVQLNATVLLIGVLGQPLVVCGAERGQEIYTTRCAVCHGEDGSGAMPGIADLTDANSSLLKSDEELLQAIIRGIQRPGAMMPPRGGDVSLTADDLHAALNYLRSVVVQSRNQTINNDK